MPLVRPPVVAGSFYPADPGELRAQVDAFLAGAAGRRSAEPGGDEGTDPPPLRPKALVAPHAGYVYSGPVAASAYALLPPLAKCVRRVVLLGPSHFVGFRGLALPAFDAFSTPLGEIGCDLEAMAVAAALGPVRVFDRAHDREHSLEVHLPFLQRVLKRFLLVPLAVGGAETEEVAEVLDALWGGEETLVVVSSDLSHYLPYATAVSMDADTCRAIESLDGRAIEDEQACGVRPLRGLLAAARRRRLVATTLDLRNSGDTAGDRSRVVGYGAWAFAG